ncbi:glycoside hydrolase family 29 protein [Aaosphaeria arxii CBS 175.79]|uniref:alpha-L-fucosidase n=1 Tax=Aaosphaeria arxii CBS 175.79 TaxID=1450172 RepID=A0A6A5XJX1_9PLEO|nr:glycoside hydrolase family 29 protein [Aaosphaeria arxii CBS 175.79]KAF2013578.1 glycoside hydrolase family 29 protein [Aaosphaeria arxii CBS 175.79]
MSSGEQIQEPARMRRSPSKVGWCQVESSVPLDLTPYYNNQGFGTYPGEASFDVLNQSYPAFPALDYGNTSFASRTGIRYNLPGYRGPSTPDNIICSGQTINVSLEGKPYFAASFLHSSDVRSKKVLGNVTFNYADNTTSVKELRSEPWWAFLTITRGELVYDSFYTDNSTNWNTSHIFEFEAALQPGKKLVSITLPNTTNTTEGRIHVFGVSLWEGSDAGIGVQSARPTQKWSEDGSQLVEVILNNSGDECVHGEGLSIEITGQGVETVEAGYIKRLCPGDQKRVTVAISGSGAKDLEVIVSQRDEKIHSRSFKDVQIGLTKWTTDHQNLARHESPEWFDNSKFGIFIHWGVYSVPGWGNSTPYESYAEWFWWYTTHLAGDRSNFRGYREETFGPELNYDDFFPNFTAAKYDPKEWVDLIADAGAKYFVITTKHHDGFALFDAGNTTNRTSLHYGPQRDLVKDLFDAAREHQPALKRGTYFSIPEWFNPSWGPYGFTQFDRPSSTSHPGIIARNPYTNKTEPYTGHIEVDDFITDVMVPQMDILAYEYGTDIVWCDAGASNGTDGFAARWFNAAREQGREVTINSRCGTAFVNDFDTPEYATFATPQRQKWESNRGMDPFSYGYNRATPDEEYMNATTLITTLVDMISKNGNLLLNIGPRADGSIPQVEIDNLREAGEWIKKHEEAIYNTTYWFKQAEVVDEGVNIRFTQTDDAFYILSLIEPIGGKLVVDAPIPILKGDRVGLVSAGEEGQDLAWSNDDGVLIIEVHGDMAAKVDKCWVFKIEYLA